MKRKDKYKLGKKCPVCGIDLLDRNKSGFCNHHRDRTGANNSFFGKSHSSRTIEKIKENTSNRSKDLWKNKEYREKIVKGTSKPRREGFKKEQSARMKKWWQENPEQKLNRSHDMRTSWKSGNIPKSEKNSMNKSKLEKEFFKEVLSICSSAIDNLTIKSDGSWYFPDICLEKDGIIIEFFGDYWHANPKMYKPDDIVHHNIFAKDIWRRDNIRIMALEEIGYKVIIVWQLEYKENGSIILDNLDMLLNWEGCAL